MTLPDALIVIIRPAFSWQDLARKYKIEVDGAIRGTLRRGGRIEVPVPAGRHQVQARIDWTGSGPIDVDVPPGAAVQVEVRPSGRAWSAWLRLGANQYLVLNVLDEPGSSA